MADNDLKIRLSVDGMAELNTLIKKFNEKNTTIAEEIKLRKTLDGLRKNTISGTESEIDLGKALVTVKESVARSSNNVLTANGKMMQSYFKLGTQIRSGLLPMLDGLPSAFRPILSSFDNVMHRLEMMGTQGVSKIDALKTAFSGGLGLAAGIALAVAGLTALITRLNDTADAQRNVIEEMERFNRNLRRMTMGQAQGELETAGGQLALLQAAKARPNLASGLPGAAGLGAAGLSWLGNLFTSTPEELDIKIKAAEDRIKKLREFIEEQDQKLVDDTIKNEEEAAKKREQRPIKEAFTAAFGLKTPEEKVRRGFAGDFAKSSSKFGGPVTGIKRIAGTDQDPFTHLKVKSDEFTESLQRGIIQSTESLADGFIKSFAIGDSLIGRFVANLSAALFNAGVASLIGSLFKVGAGVATVGVSVGVEAAGGLLGRSSGLGGVTSIAQSSARMAGSMQHQ